MKPHDLGSASLQIGTWEVMQSYPARALARRLQVDWARDPRKGPRVLMSLRALYFGHSSSIGSFFHGLFLNGWRLLSPPFLCLPLHLHGGKSPLKDPIEAQRSSLHRSSTSKLPSSGNQSTRASNELSSLKLWKEKQERKEKGKKRVEEIRQDERNKIREEERRKIMKEMKREKHASYSSHNSCKSLSEELRDYYEGRHRSHHRPHSHRREKERKPQEANINLPYFYEKDNIEANLDCEIRVEQQLKEKSTSKSYGSHSYPKKDQGQGILGVIPSKPKDNKGKIIEKQAPKASMQEKTSSIKCFKCLGRGHITSQCPTTKTMIMRGQDIYSSQDEATTSPSTNENEEAIGEESREEIYPQEEGQPLMVKEECKEVSVSSKRLAKKESHFEIKTNIKETSPLRQPPHLLLCKKTLVSTVTPLGLEVIPQVKELLDEGLVHKSLNPSALLVPKIGQILSKVEGMMQSYPARALARRLQVDWARDPRKGPRVLMSLRSSFRAQNFVLLSSSPFIHLLFPPSSYSWPPMVKNMLMQSYPARALDRRLQVDWAKDPREGPRVLMSLRAHLGGEAPSSKAYSLVDGASSLLFSFVFHCISMDLIEAQRSSLHRSPTSKLPSSARKNHNLGTNMSHHSSSVNGKGTSHKDPLARILDELSSLKLWKEKQERKEKGKKRKIREEERRKIMKEMKREKHASYSSHNSCKSLSEELRDYYEGRHRSHLRPHSHRREKERKPKRLKLTSHTSMGRTMIEQQLKKKSTSKSYGSHSYPKKDQGQGILGVTPSKPKDDKGKAIEKQAPKASMQEKTSSIKCFKCLGRGHITSQCPTTKTMIMRGQDIYSSQDEATTSPSSSESEEAKREESSEEIYPQEDGQPLVVKEKCKEVSVSSKRLDKKETHFTIKTNIKETFPLTQPPHFLFCKKTLASIATPLGLEFIPQVKKLLDEGLVHKSLNPCAFLVPKIGIIRHQVPKIGGMINVLSGATLFCKITHWARDPREGPRVLMSLRVVARKQRVVWLEYSVKRARAAASPPGCSKNGYAPQVGLAEHFKVKFWEDLEGVLQDIPQGEKVFLGGDLNGHVGSVARGFEGVHGGFGLGEMNGEGKSILEFSEALDLSIANTWFKKREEHLITYKSRGTCSQIDFFLIRKSDRKYCLNCKVIPGESLTTQHRVLVMDGEKQGIFQQKIWEGWCGQSQGSANDMWNKMSQEIIKVAKETLGESRGFGPRGKESWWWNENLQSKVRVKKECFKEWSRCRNSETWDKYKIARNETKKAVSEARAQAFDGLYQALGTRDGERSIYRLAKGRERKTRDLDQVKCVKDEEGKVLVHEKDIKERWKVYFHNLCNDGYGYDSSSLDTREEDQNYKYYRRIQKQEVKEALKRMSNGKAVGPDNIPIEVWKTLGDRGLKWLTELFNEIMRSKHMPEEWRRSTLVPIYKNKGDIQNCANYRGIKLMSHTMKLWERVIERRLRKETQVTENQFGFMPGRSTMEAIYLLRRVMEQYRMAQQDLHLIFIDLEKAYDRVPREILWKALEKKGVRVAYIQAIQDMYDRVSTSVRTQGGESDDFPIAIGLHQGSTLSPYLFTLILDVLTELIQEIAPRCMLFADDIVLLGESREELNERLETWRRALETHGFRLSRSKSEYMECKFNKRRRVSNSEVKVGDHIIPQVTRFKYLGSVIQDDGEIEGDVNHRIQAGWMKWRKASGVLCDAKVPIKLKGKFYRTAVRPTILYGTECWAVKSQHENKVGVAEMRMLRWMCGKTRQDKIRNEAIRERVGVAPIVEKMVENRLRWFGHVERRPVDSVVRRVDQMERRQTIRGRGRPKKTIREVIKKDLKLNDLDRTSSPSFLPKAHLGGEAPSSKAYSLVDGASSLLFSFVFRCISMDLIEAQRSSLHRSPTSKLPSHASYSSHDSCKSLSEELSDYYGGRYRSHPRPHSHSREKERKPQEAKINLPYFHGKDNVEAYLDREMKVEQLFACRHKSEERKVHLATLNSQGYALYWWSSLVRERRIHGDAPVEYWNDLKSALRKMHIPSYYMSQPTLRQEGVAK
ncbi:LINE-1 retrotransposable element ORF2 protein [Glycine soja]